MTFTVQNGTVSNWPSTKADPVPYVYVDGKGSVVLRSAALSAQASLEYLPAVSDTRAVIVIYTKK